MAGSTELIGIPGIQQQRVNRIGVRLNAVELIGSSQPQCLPKTGFGVPLTQSQAGFGRFIAMELHHGRCTDTRQALVNGFLGRVRDNPDTLQLWCLVLQMRKQCPSRCISYKPRRAGNTDHSDGISTEFCNGQGLAKIC